MSKIGYNRVVAGLVPAELRQTDGRKRQFAWAFASKVRSVCLRANSKTRQGSPKEKCGKYGNGQQIMMRANAARGDRKTHVSVANNNNQQKLNALTIDR